MKNLSMALMFCFFVLIICGCTSKKMYNVKHGIYNDNKEIYDVDVDECRSLSYVKYPYFYISGVNVEKYATVNSSEIIQNYIEARKNYYNMCMKEHGWRVVEHGE